MAETYDAKIFQRGGVAMVLYPDGDEAVLADVMRYMNPGMEYDQATGEALYAAPPPAEAGADWKPAQPYDMPSSGLLASQPEDQGSATGFPELDRMLTGLGNINQMLNPVEGIGQSMDASRRMLAPDTAGWDRVAALGDMLSGVAGVAAPVAAAARAGTPAAMALMEGLLGWSPTSAAAKDTAKSIARTVAERANQRGPVPVMGSNFANLLGDVGEASTGIRAYHGSRGKIDNLSLEDAGRDYLWFSNDKGYAEGLAGRKTMSQPNKGSLFEVDLNLKNPLEIDVAKESAELSDYLGIDPTDTVALEEAWRGNRNYEGMVEQYQPQMDAGGHDGIIFRNTMDGYYKPTDQYVVFDDKLISIVKKYGIAGAAAMLGVGAVDVEEAMARGQPPQGLLSMGSK